MTNKSFTDALKGTVTNCVRVNMKDLERLVYECHLNQKYDGTFLIGDYYTNHIIPVATLAVDNAIELFNEHGIKTCPVFLQVIRAVALLHDVYEDVDEVELRQITPTLRKIFGRDISEIIAFSLVLLTKDKSLKYFQNIELITKGKSIEHVIAGIVKRADNRVNMTMSFFSASESRVEKYKSSHAMCTGFVNSDSSIQTLKKHEDYFINTMMYEQVGV